MRHKKTITLFLALALTGVGVWYFQTIYYAAPVPTASTKLKSISSNAKDNSSGGIATAAQPSTGSTALASNDGSLGLFNEPVRSLMRSDKMAKVDYALLRVNTQCLAFMGRAMAANMVENSIAIEAKLSDSDKLLFGRATVDTRRAALSRSIEACSRLLEGSPVTADEMVAFNAQPNVAKWRTLAKAGQKENYRSDPAATLEFFEKVVSEPMLGSMEGFLYSGLSQSGELDKDYPAPQAVALRLLAVPFLLCQMGDDCRSGGIVNEQLCWQSGICGENVQDAILEHLRSQQINTAAFEQLVTRLRAKSEMISATIKQFNPQYRK